MVDTDRETMRDLKAAQRIIDRLANEAHDAGMLVRAWHGPRQSRLYVSRWAGGREPVSAGYVEVGPDPRFEGFGQGRPLEVSWYTRTAHDRQTMVDLAARAQELLEKAS